MTNPLDEVGWCRLGSQTKQMTRRDCNAVNGEFFEEDPGGPCVVATASKGFESDSDLEFLRKVRGKIVSRSKRGDDLWLRYSPEYYRLAIPIVLAMSRDETLRTMMRTFVVEPLVAFLRVVGAHAAGDASSPEDDGLEFALSRFYDGLVELGADDGKELAQAVLEALSSEVDSSPQRQD